jgi:DUF2075 family protein
MGGGSAAGNPGLEAEATPTTAGADFDSYVRNIYKVLLTRAMRGTVVCSTDRETQAKLAELGGRRPRAR